jgi:hypothetical protein
MEKEIVNLLTPALSSFGEEREKNFLWDDFLG